VSDDDPLLERCPFRGGACPDYAHEWRAGICPDPPTGITAQWPNQPKENQCDSHDDDSSA
jgi:hypothetical protein